MQTVLPPGPETPRRAQQVGQARPWQWCNTGTHGENVGSWVISEPLLGFTKGRSKLLAAFGPWCRRGGAGGEFDLRRNLKKAESLGKYLVSLWMIKAGDRAGPVNSSAEYLLWVTQGLRCWQQRERETQSLS